MSSANNATEGATVGGVAHNNRRSKVEYIRTKSKHTAHRRFWGNTLVEIEPNRANGFLGNRISEQTWGQKEGQKDLTTEICGIIV